jgi:DNA-binding response OmpR family regulator
MYDSVQKHRILVVEDEADIRQVLCFFLKHSDFDALGVEDGEEAMRVIPLYRPELIILDIMMHPVSGWDVLHWLSSTHLNPPIPVLVLTALVHLAEQLHGFEEGALEYLTKPTQPSIIVERVRALLTLSAEQRLLLQRERIVEQRKILDRLYAQRDDFVY